MSTTDLQSILENAPKNLIIQDALTKAHSVISKHERIMCSVSGGADSDLILDICERVKGDKQIDYVWFDTGIEFRATKEHLSYLENHYGLPIKRVKPDKSIPLSCRDYGQPFISKQVSEFLMRLQINGFDFSRGDRCFEELFAEYPKCKSALLWWCNQNSIFNITNNKYLREFLIDNPPKFKISNKCCTYAKKKPSERTQKVGNYDLIITGVRRVEGVNRRIAYKNCFTKGDDRDTYRPIFWFMDEDKEEYCEYYGVRHSDCYTQYGMTRTGCVGCPYARALDFEKEVMETYEPNLYKVAMMVFKDAYEYTQAYKEYVNKKGINGQMRLFDFINETEEQENEF